MNRRHALLTLVAIPLGVHAQGMSGLGSMASSLKDPLVGLLTSQLGITENQAQGGIGSYLTLAKEKLAKGDFDKIAGLIPGASKYMDSAKKLGAVTGPVGNLAGLNGSLGKLGMAPDTVAKFAPTVTDAVGKIGGDSVTKMLAGIMK